MTTAITASAGSHWRARPPDEPRIALRGENLPFVPCFNRRADARTRFIHGNALGRFVVDWSELFDMTMNRVRTLYGLFAKDFGESASERRLDGGIRQFETHKILVVVRTLIREDEATGAPATTTERVQR